MLAPVRAVGTLLCGALGAVVIVSSAPAQVLPCNRSPEVCDGRDNNCNNVVDEHVPVTSCYTGPSSTQNVGLCRAGTTACVGGSSVCQNEVLPTRETCDGQDNDCDGKADSYRGQPLRRACYSGPAGTAGVGECRKGHQECSAGVWSTACSGEVTPTTEVCDAKDNDCDGLLNERATAMGARSVCANTHTGTSSIICSNNQTDSDTFKSTGSAEFQLNAQDCGADQCVIKTAMQLQVTLAYLQTEEFHLSISNASGSVIASSTGSVSAYLGMKRRTVSVPAWTDVQAQNDNRNFKISVKQVSGATCVQWTLVTKGGKF